MKIESLELNGAYHIEPKLYEDSRGFFYESFQRDRFREETGVDFNIVQINNSKSTKGVLRGLHYQLNPYAQAKLVSVVRGEVQDIIVDIRRDSPTYGEHVSTILNSEKKNQLYIPKGFAHGFLVLSEEAEFSYAIDSSYAPEYECGIIYDDSTLSIDWQLEDLIISDKDHQLKTFLQADNNFD